MPKTNLLGFSRIQMEDLLESWGQPRYKGRQLYKWLYRMRQYDFALMTDLSKDLRSRLDDEFEFRLPEVKQEAVSVDGTVKLLFCLDDGHPIESVLIPDESGRATCCISSQAGCALACRFCATGTMGLLRDLTPGEIVGQLIYLRDRFGDGAFNNIVMMGMGEPLHNYANVIAAMIIVTAEDGLAVSPRRVTLSTSGISPKIKRLADSDLKLNLAVSLHAATQEKRVRIMPVAQTFKLDKLMEAVRYYAKKTTMRVTFEYIVIKDFNDSMKDVKALSALLRGISCRVNLLAYNPVPGLDLERPSDERVDWFGRQLYPRVPAVTVRKSRGLDIDAACGQLAARNLEGGRHLRAS